MTNYLTEYLDTKQNIVIVSHHKEPWQTQRNRYLYTGVIPTNGKHRLIMSDEIIIEFDYPTEQKNELRPIATNYINKLSQILKQQQINHHIIDWEGGRSPHLRFRIEGLKYHTIETIPEYKRIIIEKIKQKIKFNHQNIQIDDMSTSNAHLCCLEGSTHYKHGTEVKIVDKYTDGTYMQLNKKIIRSIQKELINEKNLKKEYEQIKPSEIKINKLKEFFKQNYVEGIRNSLICALAGQCKRIGLTEEQSINILNVTLDGINDDVPVKTREDEFKGTLRKPIDDLAVYHYFKKAFNTDYDAFYDETKIKYQEFQLAFINKELSITSTELLEMDVDDTKYIIDGMMYDEGFMYIAGPPKAFKTYFAIHIATKIAKGENVLEKFYTEKKKVLYIDEENRIKGIKRKYKQICGEHIPNLHFLISPGCKLSPGDDTTIIAEIERIKPEVIVFDSLIRFSKGDENNASEMKIVFDRVKDYITKYNLSVIALHHTTKESTNTKTGILSSMKMRGSGDLAAQADTVIMMSKKDKNTFVINVDMDRYDEPIGAYKMLLSVKDDKFTLTYGGKITEKNETEIKLNKLLKPNKWYDIEGLATILGTAESTTRQTIRRYVTMDLLLEKNEGRKKVYSINEEEFLEEE